MSGGGDLWNPGSKRPIGKDTVLVAEGRDTGSFVFQLLRHMGIEQRIEVRNGGGVPQLFDYLQDLVLVSGFAQVKCLGIVLDSEFDPSKTLQQLCAGLARAGLPAPLQAAPASGLPQVVVQLLPDAHTPGMLETLIWRAIGLGPLAHCTDQFLACVRHAGQAVPRVDKARLHCWIAAQEDPALLVGQAAQAGYFPWSAGEFDELKAFLHGLLGPTT